MIVLNLSIRKSLGMGMNQQATGLLFAAFSRAFLCTHIGDLLVVLHWYLQVITVLLLGSKQYTGS